MAVRCLTKVEKETILHWYNQRVFNQKELADRFRVSERTINRVLIEAGIATPIARIKGEAYQVMKLLKQYGVDYHTLNMLLERHAA